MKMFLEKSINKENIYSPQPNKFEGYNYFPRPASRPYVNKLQYFEASAMKIPSEIFTERLLNKSNENTIRNGSLSFLTNNVGVSHLTGAHSCLKMSKDKNKIIQEIDSKLKLNKVKKFIINKNSVNGEHPYKMQGDGRGLAELRQEIKQGNFKVTKDVGKVVALKHIFDRNNSGIMIHGRNLKTPTECKTQYFAGFIKRGSKHENAHHRSLKASTAFANYENTEEEHWNPTRTNTRLLKSLTNKFDCSPTRERMTKFNIIKGGFVDNYAIKSKYFESKMNPFMTMDFSQFTRPLPVPETPAEAVPESPPPKGKDKQKKEDLEPKEDPLKKIKENNVLFEGEQDDSELSEINDPLIQGQQKSKQFLSTKMRQFQLDSERFSIGEHSRLKNKVKLNNKFINVPLRDQGDQWRNDRNWRRKCNPYYRKRESVEDRKDRKMLEKRHHAHKLKNLALQQDLKGIDKKIIKELRNVLF